VLSKFWVDDKTVVEEGGAEGRTRFKRVKETKPRSEKMVTCHSAQFLAYFSKSFSSVA